MPNNCGTVTLQIGGFKGKYLQVKIGRLLVKEEVEGEL